MWECSPRLSCRRSSRPQQSKMETLFFFQSLYFCQIPETVREHSWMPIVGSRACSGRQLEPGSFFRLNTHNWKSDEMSFVFLYSYGDLPHWAAKHRLGPCSPSVHHTLEGVLDIENTFNIFFFLEHQVLRGIPSEVDVIVRRELQPNCVNSEKVKVKT